MLNIQGCDCSATSSLQWKVPYLEEYVTNAAEWFAIISITETWVKPPLTKAQLSIAGYNIYRSDRMERERGAGAFMFMKLFLCLMTLNLTMIIARWLFALLIQQRCSYFLCTDLETHLTKN